MFGRSSMRVIYPQTPVKYNNIYVHSFVPQVVELMRSERVMFALENVVIDTDESTRPVRHEIENWFSCDFYKYFR